MMFQSYALFPHLSALDNVAFSLKMRGMGKAERQRKAQELLEAGRTWRARRSASRLALSGGQQQRVALAARADAAAQGAAARRAAVGARPLPAREDAGRTQPLAQELG